MGKVKILTVTIPENDDFDTLTHYLKLGFEKINITQYTRRTDSGEVIDSYYKCLLKFDFGQKNADKLWACYKSYKKKREKVARLKAQSSRDFYLSGSFFILACIIAIVLLPFIPMMFGNDFCDFTHEVGFLFDLEKEFDFVLFFGAIFIGVAAGLIVAIVVAIIDYLLFRNKRMLFAMDHLPAAEDELEDFISNAEKLKS